MKVTEIWLRRFFIDEHHDAKFKEILYLALDHKGKVLFRNDDLKPYDHEIFEIIDELTVRFPTGFRPVSNRFPSGKRT